MWDQGSPSVALWLTLLRSRCKMVRKGRPQCKHQLQCSQGTLSGYGRLVQGDLGFSAHPIRKCLFGKVLTGLGSKHFQCCLRL